MCTPVCQWSVWDMCLEVCRCVCESTCDGLQGALGRLRRG